MDPDVTPELLAERLAELLTPWEFSADEMLLPSAHAVLALSDDDVGRESSTWQFLAHTKPRKKGDLKQ
jgi:hypothetical protein